MRSLVLATVLATVFSVGVRAQDYPTRPVTLIIPTAVGGGNNSLGRVLGDYMSRSLGQPFVIENHGGAAGMLASRMLSKSPADGYMLGMANSGTVGMAPNLYRDAGYNSRRDFSPIGLIAASTVVLVINPSVPAHSVQELIELAKREPGKLTFGTGGAGSASHLFAEMFANMAGIKLTHVPFRGLGPAMNDLLGGHISMIFSSIPTAIGNIKAGSLRALATTSLTRFKALPDVPTVSESGLKGYEAEQRYGMLAPAGTPPAVVAKLNTALRTALKSDEVKQQIDNEGAEVVSGTPEDYARDIDRELAKWSVVIRAAGLSPQ